MLRSIEDTDEAEGVDFSAVLPLAQKYDLPRLVGLCGRAMLQDLTADNVANACILSDFREDQHV